MIRFYRQFIPAGSLCFDIGAHLGNRIPVFRSLSAHVIAVEPQPSCVEYLNKKFGADPMVEIFPVALGASRGQADFFLSNATPTVSTLADSDWRNELNASARFKSNWDASIRVPVWTIEQLIEKFGVPDFSKIDVEGFELEVLQGLQQALPCLSFEFFIYSPERTKLCLSRLLEIGDYSFNWSIREQHRFQEQDWLPPEKLMEKLLIRQNERFSGDIYARLQTLAPLN